MLQSFVFSGKRNEFRVTKRFSLSIVLPPLAQPPSKLIYYRTIRFWGPRKPGLSGRKFILDNI